MPPKQNKIGVLGLGSWGTALAEHLAKQGHQVIAWTINPEVRDSVNQKHSNPTYLPEVSLHSNLRATIDLVDLEDADYLLSVLPAKALKEVFPQVKINPQAKFISATKGLDPDTRLTPVALAEELLPNLSCYGVISGPGFAIDIANGKPAGIVVAANKQDDASQIAKLFSASNLKVYTSTDVIGVELGGTVKNIIAIAAGVSDGLELGDSACAGLITRGLAEMLRLAETLGAKRETLFGLSGLGDLVLTACSDTSRNRRTGLYLGSGMPLPDVLNKVGSTVEGILATEIIYSLSKKHQLEMPITEGVYQLIQSKVSPQDLLAKLMRRGIKEEF